MVGMDRALATIATEGWIPMAAVMLGTANRPLMWPVLDLGQWLALLLTSGYCPPALSEREMYSCFPVGNSGTQRVSRTLPFRNGLLTLMLTKDLMGSALLLS